jgi:hypothetical protein
MSCLFIHLVLELEMLTNHCGRVRGDLQQTCTHPQQPDLITFRYLSSAVFAPSLILGFQPDDSSSLCHKYRDGQAPLLPARFPCYITLSALPSLPQQCANIRMQIEQPAGQSRCQSRRTHLRARHPKQKCLVVTLRHTLLFASPHKVPKVKSIAFSLGQARNVVVLEFRESVSRKTV